MSTESNQPGQTSQPSEGAGVKLNTVICVLIAIAIAMLVVCLWMKEGFDSQPRADNLNYPTYVYFPSKEDIEATKAYTRGVKKIAHMEHVL